MNIRLIYLLLISTSLFSCDNNVLDVPEKQTIDLSTINGTGTFLFEHATTEGKPLRVYYHIPNSADINTKIMIAFHGNGRDAIETRDLLIDDANNSHVIVIVPLFSDEFYPGSNSYHYGNVFKDGDKPSSTTINPEDEWTFSIIDPLFQFVKQSLKSNRETFDIFGHSAGAQFAHRLFFFKPNLSVDRIALSAAGWYTLINDSTNFPYGFGSSPLLSRNKSDLVSHNISIIVGENDNDPNAPSLRRNKRADIQGDNRYDRAFYFYNQGLLLSQALSVSFDWSIHTVPNTGHDINANAQVAFNLLYP